VLFPAHAPDFAQLYPSLPKILTQKQGMFAGAVNNITAFNCLQAVKHII
jgi:hypothetical protein